MTRFFRTRELAASLAGAVVCLLAMGLVAPSRAEAGCSHFVTSRTDPSRLTALIEPLFNDLAGRSEPLPFPSPPLPCSGVFCSGQPAVPTVPAGVTDWRVMSWAWFATTPESAWTGPTFLSLETIAPDPMHRAIAVFRPPRFLLPSA